jgi:hypothetical protein
LTAADVAFLAWLESENGYRHARPIGAGRYAAIRPMAFTHAVITGRIGDRIGTDGHWCYHTYPDALVALMRWDGEGEPDGWLRSPGTGRRRSESPDEIDENGNAVGAVGVIYRRW